MNCKKFILPAILLFAMATNAQQKTAKTIFYFIDATCENCSLNKTSEKNNYWLVTSRVFQTYNLKTDSIVKAFKQEVKKQYPFLTDAYKTTVVRWQNSFADITTTLENKRKKMLVRNFSEVKIE